MHVVHTGTGDGLTNILSHITFVRQPWHCFWKARIILSEFSFIYKFHNDFILDPIIDIECDSDTLQNPQFMTLTIWLTDDCISGLRWLTVIILSWSLNMAIGNFETIRDIPSTLLFYPTRTTFPINHLITRFPRCISMKRGHNINRRQLRAWYQRELPIVYGICYWFNFFPKLYYDFAVSWSISAHC